MTKALIKTDKEFQIAVQERDGGFCRICTNPADCAHHIIHRFEKKVRNDIENGISLCVRCHNKVHNGLIKQDEIQSVMEQLYGPGWWQRLTEKAR